MINVDTLELENNEKYVSVKTFKKNGIKYYLLSNVNDRNDVCVRKEIEENGEAYISMLDNEEELRMALEEFKNS